MEVKKQESLRNIMWSYLKSSLKQTWRDYTSPVDNFKYVFFGKESKEIPPDKHQNKNTPPVP